MSAALRGLISWSMTRDEGGYRDYKAVYRVETTSYNDGPAIVLLCPGLPRPGQIWNVGNDRDLWAWCRNDATVQPDQHKEGDPHRFWTVELTFSNKPLDLNKQRCNDLQIEDPLLEAPKISGSTESKDEEAYTDRFGNPVITSSFEQLRGPQVEFPRNYSVVRIEQNIATSYQAITLPTLMANSVNDRPLWGMPKRTIRLSDHSWELKYYGLCYRYYTRTLQFTVDSRTFDRILLDEGTKALHGHNSPDTGEWVIDDMDDFGTPPNPKNPQHFVRYTDRFGNLTRVILDGNGRPIDVDDDILSCSQCPEGAPSVWYLHGLGNVIELHHIAGCLWEALDSNELPDGDLGTLLYIPASNSWEFARQSTNDPSITNNWSFPQVGGLVQSWACLGPNTLYKTSGESSAPPTVHVTQRLAGRILLQKLEESNFLLLGIPILL